MRIGRDSRWLAAAGFGLLLGMTVGDASAGNIKGSTGVPSSSTVVTPADADVGTVSSGAGVGGATSPGSGKAAPRAEGLNPVVIPRRAGGSTLTNPSQSIEIPGASGTTQP